MAVLTEDIAEALTKLGLTYTQARIYLSTLQIGKASVKMIAESSKVAREDVYRVLPSLQEMGLISKLLDYPTKYEAIQPRDAVTALTRIKEKEFEQTQQTAKFLQENLARGYECNSPEKIMVVNAPGIHPSLMQILKRTKKSFDFTTTYDLFSHAMNNLELKGWIDGMLKAKRRGVTFRMIVHTTDGNPISNVPLQISSAKALVFQPNFRYRYAFSPPECILILFDEKECVIETSTKIDTRLSPYIITNNPILVNITKSYFRMLWNTALDPQEQELPLIQV